MVSKKKIQPYIITFFCLFPFVPNSFQIFSSQAYNAFIIWKILVLSLVCIQALTKTGGKIILDGLLKAIIISMVLLAVPTLIHSGSITKYFGFVFDSLGIVYVIKNICSKYREYFFLALRLLIRLIIYLNLFLLLIFPDGIFVGHSMNMAVRYNFLGMDNQAAAIIITFMAILIALDKLDKRSSMLILLDVIAIITSLMLLWCATAIVGGMVFISILCYRRFLKGTISLKTGLILITIAFFLIVFFRIYELMSFIIVDVLGKNMGLSGRIELWSSAIRTWLEYPVLGHGIQQTELLVYFSIMNDYRHAHNQFLQILINGGVVYMLAFIYMLIRVERKIDKHLSNTSVYIMGVGMISFLFMGIADAYSHMVGLYFLIATAYYYADCIEHISAIDCSSYKGLASADVEV